MIKEILSWFTFSFFSLWFIITVLNQHRKSRKWISFIINYDYGSLVPIWTFFAPNPGRTDIYLLYRDRDSEGNISTWHEIKTGNRSSWYDQWSPLRRIQKGLVDLAPGFTNHKVEEPGQIISKRHIFDFPYLLFLNYICTQPADFRAQTRQFALAVTDGHGTENDIRVVFLSSFHKIEHF
jgi:hypothetical protein